MIVLKILNGAGQGNQMFMYSMAYALHKKTNQKILIYVETSFDRSKSRPYILDNFNLDEKIIKKVIRMDKIRNKIIYSIVNFFFKIIFKLLPNQYKLVEQTGQSRYFKNIPLKYKNYILNGCFECFEYFDKYYKDLSKQFLLNYEFDQETKKLYNSIIESNSVSLHVRVGDFLKEGRNFNLDYYISMMKKLNSIFKDCIFYVACQDEKTIEPLKEHGNIVIINTSGVHKDLNDWNALRLCKHHILTNSTYSWWAAYLSENQDVYIPTKDIYLNAQNCNDEETYSNFFKW